MTEKASSESNRAKWEERVRAWRASGLPAEEFATSRGFAEATLKWWSYRLRKQQAPKFIELVPKVAAAPVASRVAEIVVEVGGARVRVAPGFDDALLGEVVRALASAAR